VPGRGVPARAFSPNAKEIEMRDMKLAAAVAGLLDAADNAKDLIDEAERNGWGHDDDGEEWPKERPGDIQMAIVQACHAVRTALQAGDYWDDYNELRKD
jgi:hypothetical protein